VVPPRLSIRKRTVPLCCGAFALCASWISRDVTNAQTQISPSPSATVVPQISESSKGKSDEELLRLVMGRLSPTDQKLSEEYAEEDAKFASLDRL
jgi:phage-related baseplate assembly protein